MSLDGQPAAVERALIRARAQPGVFWEVDEQASGSPRGDGTPRPLAGVPVAVKDSFAVAGMGQSLGFAHREVSERDADAVARLRQLGAVIVGKTAMDQLGWTMTGLAPGRPEYESPALPGHMPGGSSGGSAAAVGLGIVPVALGADTAGSVRLPAAWCGVVGFIPTHGAISTAGCAAVMPEFDTVGIFARGVEAAAATFRAMAGVLEGPAEIAIRIGIPRELLDAQSWVAAALDAWTDAEAAIKSVAHAGIGVDGMFRTRGVGTLFAARLHARWREAVSQQPDDLLEPTIRESLKRGSEITQDEVKSAAAALAEDRQEALSVFGRVDLLALPTATIGPPPLGSSVSVASASALTRQWSIYGCPAIAIPLPGHPGLSLQLVGPPGGDARVLSFARRVELALESTRRMGQWV